MVIADFKYIETNHASFAAAYTTDVVAHILAVVDGDEDYGKFQLINSYSLVPHVLNNCSKGISVNFLLLNKIQNGNGLSIYIA